MSATPIIVLEQFFNEIQAELIAAAAKNALDQGQSIKAILTPIYQSYLPKAAQRLSAFEQSEPTLVNFLLIKRKLLETKKWLEATAGACRAFYESKANLFECNAALTEAEAAINDQLLLVNARIPSVYTSIKAQLPTNYNASLEKVYAELEQIMQRHISFAQEKAPDTELSWRQFLDLSKRQLSQFATLCIVQKDVRLQALLQEGRSMYFTKFPNISFSLLNSWTGAIYVVMDVIGQVLGQGETKIVTRAVELETGKIVALVKPRTLFHDAKQEGEEIFMRNRTFVQSWRESDMLIRLKGTPGIISVIERIPFEIEQVRHLFLVEQRYEDGSLEKNLNAIIKGAKVEETFNEPTAISLALQLLTGLSQLHQFGIVHRDIKADNILCDWTDPSYKQAVICDFNLACTILEKDLHKKLAFSPFFGAPEYARFYLNKEEVGREALVAIFSFSLDIWSMGLVLYQLFFLAPLPWGNQIQHNNSIPIEETFRQICLQISELKENWIPKQFSTHRFFPLINSMLCVDPAQRISAAAALAECQRLSQIP